MLSLTVAGQRFETIAGQDCEVLERRCRFQTAKLQARRPFDSGEGFHQFPGGEVSDALVSIAYDQSQGYPQLCLTSSITRPS